MPFLGYPGAEADKMISCACAENDESWTARTRNTLSAAHSLSVNFSVRAFCGSSSVSVGAGPVVSGTVGFVSGSELAGGTLDIMVGRERGKQPTVSRTRTEEPI